MNIEVFIEKRKRMHFSQAELAQGICTQATLSKFERNGKVPSFRILLKLCDRLGLTLNELFPVDQGNSDRQAVLDSVENHLLQERYPEMLRELAELGESPTDTARFQMRYYFLRGYAMALGGGDLTRALADFAQILERLDAGHHTMFSVLAYAGTGIAYDQAGEADRAETYFNQVAGAIRQLTFRNRYVIWRALNVVYYTAEYYSRRQEFTVSDDLLSYGFQICARYHVTYYLARITYRHALNLLAQRGDLDEIRAEFRDAAAFARLNGNHRVQLLIADELAGLDRYPTD